MVRNTSSDVKNTTKPKFEPHESHQTLGMNSGKVCNSWNTSGTRRATFVTNLLIF